MKCLWYVLRGAFVGVCIVAGIGAGFMGLVYLGLRTASLFGLSPDAGAIFFFGYFAALVGACFGAAQCASTERKSVQ